ncbi:LytTR family transcriptional regulator DNA-binding domain-containing protein [Fluviicola sp.]|jgi:two-component system LytT family response regulator|uniref:LytR/AlgR family response regulator transcription factor n=1 Tax=Fluviicola sp. TaxID=1917219 RepID=UPI0028363CF4|nr:LytTR family transcriptional regulator DNA-binding domain-containing protein [Fluviicola sp.]MDR0803440.1 LytTR family transcriptional regulator DNA-binding domain-containing protein [Fluviicola sp.]
MIKAFIVDDEPLAREVVKKHLQKYGDITLVGEASDGFEALKLIPELKPDLLFLDVQMPKISGFELLELLSDMPSVIFTTAFDEFALKAFEVNALDYLLKPFSEERFDAAVSKKRNSEPGNSTQKTDIPLQIIHEQNRIVIKDGTEIKIVPVQDVDYIEAYDDYVKIYQGKKYILKKQTMNHFEQVLPKDQFIRIHRSYILNVNQLTKIESYEKNSYVAILKSGSSIPISRSSYSDLKSRLGL